MFHETISWKIKTRFFRVFQVFQTGILGFPGIPDRFQQVFRVFQVFQVSILGIRGFAGFPDIRRGDDHGCSSYTDHNTELILYHVSSNARNGSGKNQEKQEKTSVFPSDNSQQMTILTQVFTQGSIKS